MSDRKTLLWIYNQTKRRIPMLVLLTLVNAACAGLSVVFALGSRNVIDTAVAGSGRLFLRACLLQGAVILGILILQALNRYLAGRLTMELDRDWKRRMLRRLIHGEYAAVSGYHSGELINRLNNDVRILDDGLVTVAPGLCSMAVQLAAAMVALVMMQPLLSVVILAFGVVAIFLTGVLRRRMKQLHKKASEADGRLLSYLQETFEKLMVVKALDVADEVQCRSETLLENRYEVQRKRRNLSLFSSTGIGVMYRVTGFLALVWCAFGLLKGRITFGTLTAVTQLVGQLQTPFVQLSGVLPKYTAMLAAADRLMELDLLPQEQETELPEPQKIYEQLAELRAEGLSFSYGKDPILTNTSFALPKGVFAAMTGASGIGKSTLLKLLLGIYPPTGGALTLCGGETSVTLSRCSRKLFAYVPQGNYLFSGTLRDNLLLIRPEATEEELRNALYVSAMDQVLQQLPDGLDTVIGENSQGLSEGQAQRLAIARALLSGAPILLLDEATSALDAGTEALVLERMAALPNRTCIAVTHRPAALEIAHWRLDVADHQIRAIKLKENRSAGPTEE